MNPPRKSPPPRRSPGRRSKPSARRSPPSRRSPSRATPPRRSAPGPRGPRFPWPWVLGGVAGLIVLLIVGGVLARTFLAAPEPTPFPTATRYPTVTSLAPTATDAATPPPGDTPETTAAPPPLATQRLVVFEAFLRPECPNCQAAARSIESELAPNYPESSVLFLEYNADAGFSREELWWASHGSGSVTLPMVMCDSGRQVSSGYEEFADVYAAMVDAALARAPLADLAATAQRSGSDVRVEVSLTNRSGSDLGPGNMARVWAIVYETFAGAGDRRLTQRVVLAVTNAAVTDAVAPDATTSLAMTVPAVAPTDWANVRVMAMADYRPIAGGYDMLQAIVVPLTP